MTDSLTDFYRQNYDRWFETAVRRAALIGGIQAWATAPLDKPSYGKPVTAAKALAQIRRLLAQYQAEQHQSETGGGL